MKMAPIERDTGSSASPDVNMDYVGVLKERNAVVDRRVQGHDGDPSPQKDGSKKADKKASKKNNDSRMVVVEKTDDADVAQAALDPIESTQPSEVPKIDKKSLNSTPCNAGTEDDEMFVVGNNFGRDTTVVFREVAADGTIVWESEVDYDPKFWRPVHLVCIVPPYRSLDITENVAIQVLVKSGGRYSEPSPFTYTPREDRSIFRPFEMESFEREEQPDEQCLAESDQASLRDMEKQETLYQMQKFAALVIQEGQADIFGQNFEAVASSLEAATSRLPSASEQLFANTRPSAVDPSSATIRLPTISLRFSNSSESAPNNSVDSANATMSTTEYVVVPAGTTAEALADSLTRAGAALVPQPFRVIASVGQAQSSGSATGQNASVVSTEQSVNSATTDKEANKKAVGEGNGSTSVQANSSDESINTQSGVRDEERDAVSGNVLLITVHLVPVEAELLETELRRLVISGKLNGSDRNQDQERTAERIGEDTDDAVETLTAALAATSVCQQLESNQEMQSETEEHPQD